MSFAGVTHAFDEGRAERDAGSVRKLAAETEDGVKDYGLVKREPYDYELESNAVVYSTGSGFRCVSQQTTTVQKRDRRRARRRRVNSTLPSS